MRSLGYKYEEKAIEWLKKHNYKIVQKNFHTMFGEIDIIAEKKEELHFIEVKASTKKSFIPLTYKINPTKKERLIKTASTYLSTIKETKQIIFSLITIENKHPTFYKNILQYH